MDEEKINEIIDERFAHLIKSDRFVFEKLIQILDGRNIQTGKTTGTKFGTEAAQKIALHGATPTIQSSKISDPSGQANDLDSEARTAINAIIDVLEAKGTSASS